MCIFYNQATILRTTDDGHKAREWTKVAERSL